MASLIKMRNGTRKVANRKRRSTRRRRNPVVAKVANRKRRRRNPTSASVRSVIPNGMKLVANRKRRRRRNGVALVANKKRHHRRRRNGIALKRNGLFSGAKHALNKNTATVVLGLLAGMGVTKVESALLGPIAAQFLSYVGLQNYANPLVQAGMSLTVNRMAADAIKRGSGEYVMYGGLAMATMELIISFFPSANAYNPFSNANTVPLVLNQPAIISPGAAAALQMASGGSPVGAKVGAALRPRVGVGAFRPRV